MYQFPQAAQCPQPFRIFIKIRKYLHNILSIRSSVFIKVDSTKDKLSPVIDDKLLHTESMTPVMIF